MFNSALAEIISIEGRLLSVKPIGMYGGVIPPVIHDVPLGLLGNMENHTDHKLVVGNIVPILFTTLDIGNYISFGSKDTVSDVGINNYNSCIALPITFDVSQLNLALPESISKVGNEKHKGNLEQTGTQKVTGICESDTDYVSAGVSGKNHTHDYRPGTGSPTPTDKPK